MPTLLGERCPPGGCPLPTRFGSPIERKQLSNVQMSKVKYAALLGCLFLSFYTGSGLGQVNKEDFHVKEGVAQLPDISSK